MPLRAWPLALLVACSISWAGPDFDLMDTENGETLKLGEFRATVGARYYEQQDDSKLLSPRFGFDAGIGPWAELSLRYDYRILNGSPRFDDDSGSGDPVLRVKGMPWESSFCPGPSPTSMTRAVSGPTPGTGPWQPARSGQRVQARTGA